MDVLWKLVLDIQTQEPQKSIYQYVTLSQSLRLVFHKTPHIETLQFASLNSSV